ncbi:hypothetical protein L7F22_062632 [Adiantum nelumboides]|nr:hypothetical protein [Adiantum nelumboides]
MEQQAPQVAPAVGQLQVAAAVPAQIQPPPPLPGAAGYPPPVPLAYQHIHQQQLQQFWTSQMQEIEQVNDFRNHQLPLARIKKIMKADEDVRMISAEAPVVFSKACELFILELTLRSWMNTEENKRRTLQKNDIASAITRTDIFDFLVDIVPRDELKEEGIGLARSGLPLGASTNASHYGAMYYTQQPEPLTGGVGHSMHGTAGSSGMLVGRAVAPMDSAMYPSQARSTMPYVAHQPMPQGSRVVACALFML